MNNRFTLFYKALFGAAVLTAASFSAHAQGVGVGTTAPDASAALDVVASNKGALLPRMTAAGRTGILSPATGLIVFQTDGTPGFYYNSGTTTPVWQQIATAAGTSTGFIQNQNAADQVASFRISGSGSTLGNFGVGTSAPQLLLDVTSGISGIGLRNSAAWDHMYWFHDGTTAFMRAGGAELGLALQVGISGTGTYGDASQAYRDVMRLLPNGNVGIGTIAPTEKLDVVGNIQSSANIAVDYNNANAGTVANTLRFGPTNSSEGIGSKRNATGNQFGIDFYTRSANRMAITNLGNVGIGTTTPTALLDVAGNARIEGLTTAGLVTTDALGNLSSGTAASLDPTTASNGLTKVGSDFRLGGTLAAATTIAQGGNAFSLTGGNVGIGITAPIQKLEVEAGGIRASGNGAFTAVSATNQGAHLQWNRSGGEGETWLINHMGGGNGNAGIRFAGITTSTGTVPTEWARFNNVGNLGVGTSTPTEKLVVSTSVGSTPNTTHFASVETVVNPFINSTQGINIIKNDGQVRGFKLYQTGSDDVNSSFRIASTNAGLESDAITIKRNTGNVGIGTTAPLAGLHVDTPESGNTTALGIIASGGTTGNPSIELRGSGKLPYIDFAETSGVDYTTRLSSSGGVLNVNGAGTGGLLFKVNGNMQATNVAFTSDARFKTNVRPLGGALVAVLALRGVRYTWNALGIQHGGTAHAEQVGVLAQEIEKVYPELVSTGTDGYKAVNYAQLAPVLIEAMKEQQQQIEALKAQNQALQARTALVEADHASLLSLQAQLARLLGEGTQARK